jgi:hypothetical protein
MTSRISKQSRLYPSTMSSAQRDLFDTQMQLEDQLIDQGSPLVLDEEPCGGRVVETRECWACKKCGREWSFMMGDNEVPETCP